MLNLSSSFYVISPERPGEEMLLDKEQRIARPRQIYTGQATRDVPPRDER